MHKQKIGIYGGRPFLRVGKEKRERTHHPLANSTFMLLENANDDNTYNFGIKMIWRAVAVSFSEAHPFVFWLFCG